MDNQFEIPIGDVSEVTVQENLLDDMCELRTPNVILVGTLDQLRKFVALASDALSQ